LRLLGREDVDKAPAKGIKMIRVLNVPVQRGRVELGEDEDAVDARVEAVADRDIHQPVFACQGYGRLAAFGGQRMQPGSPTSAHDYGDNIFIRFHDIRVTRSNT